MLTKTSSAGVTGCFSTFAEALRIRANSGRWKNSFQISRLFVVMVRRLAIFRVLVSERRETAVKNSPPMFLCLFPRAVSKKPMGSMRMRE